MACVEICADSVPLLSELLPLVAMALSSNVTYLLLERFRYREEIRSSAEAQLKRLEDGECPDSLKQVLKQSRSYKELKGSATLPNNEDTDKNSTQKTPLPADLWWGLVYRKLFERHRDRGFSWAFICVCCILLSVGVAHEIPTLQYLGCFLPDKWIECFLPDKWIEYFLPDTWNILPATWINIYFYSTIGMGLLPVSFLFLGRRIVKRAKKHAEDNGNELSKLADLMRKNLGTVEIKAPE